MRRAWALLAIALVPLICSAQTTYLNSKGFTIDTATGAMMMAVSPTAPTYLNSQGLLVDATGAIIVTFANGINGPITQVEAAAPSGVALSDILFADSTAHRWKMINNNGAAEMIASGTGTDNKLPKFTTGASGILGDSALSDNATNVISTEGLVFSGAAGAATTISTSTTNADLSLTPNGTGGINFPNGATATPSIKINSAGFYSGAANSVIFQSAASADKIQFGATGIKQVTSGIYGWSNSSSSTSAAADTNISRVAAGYLGVGSGAQGSVAGFIKTANTVATAADVTCGTGGTISNCTAATTITGLTFTLPLVATNWSMDCDLVVGQATAVTANQWLIQTATNGVTNTVASYDMYTAATAAAGGAITGQGSTTTAFQITPSWTLGAINTKMPVHIHAFFEGVSASGTVINLQIISSNVSDLTTIYRGATCSLQP